MNRSFTVVWLTSICLTVAIVIGLLGRDVQTSRAFPDHYLPPKSDIFFIGSSFNKFLFPPVELENGVLDDGRQSEHLSINGISEEYSTTILADVINLAPQTIFLEINAYVYDYLFEETGSKNPAIVNTKFGNLGFLIENVSVKLRTSIKHLLKFKSQSGAVEITRGVNPGLNPQEINLYQIGETEVQYRFKIIEPEYPEALKTELERARNRNIEVIFLFPPRPEVVVRDWIGLNDFNALLLHVRNFAEQFGLKVWLSEEPWPNQLFLDRWAHFNMHGQERFQKELAQWYKGVQ